MKTVIEYTFGKLQTNIFILNEHCNSSFPRFSKKGEVAGEP